MLSERLPTESVGWNGLQALKSQLTGRLAEITRHQRPSGQTRDSENNAAFFETDLRYILKAKPVVVPLSEERYKDMDNMSLCLLAELNDIVNRDLINLPDGKDFHESKSPGNMNPNLYDITSPASSHEWLAAMYCFLKAHPEKSFSLTAGPDPSLFKLPSGGHGRKAKGYAKQWRAFLDSLAAEKEISQGKQSISLEAIGLSGELNDDQSDILEMRASGVVSALFKEFERLNCADLRTHEIKLRLSGLNTDPSQPLLDVFVSSCPNANATLEIWHEARCGPFSVVIDNTEKRSLCDVIDQAISENTKLHLLVNQQGLFNVTDKLPMLSSSSANFKTESLNDLLRRNLFKRITLQESLQGATEEKVGFKEKVEISLKLAKCLLEFFDNDIELASHSWAPEQIFFLSPSTTTLAARGEVYVSLRPRRSEAESVDLDLLKEFEPGNPILLSFARLLLEIETGEEIGIQIHPEKEKRMQSWGFLCRFVKDKKAKGENVPFMDAVEGCLYLCNNLPRSKDRVTGSTASKVLRKAIYEKIIRKLETITNPPDSKRKRQSSVSEYPQPKKLSTAPLETKVPVVAVVCPERITTIPSTSETPFDHTHGEKSTTLKRQIHRKAGGFDGRFCSSQKASTNLTQPRTFDNLNWTWDTRFEPKDDDDTIRIAILDTGFDIPRMETKNEQMRMKSWKNFCGTDENDVQDLDGHGTQVASIILRLAPRAELCIARICHGDVKHGIQEGERTMVAKENYIRNPEPEIIKNAIKWAIEQKVNIINLSFGFADVDPGVDDALKLARDEGILIFAAMSNEGIHERAAWPARESNDAIGIHSCSDMGKTSSSFTPMPVKRNLNFMVVGEGIIAPRLTALGGGFCAVEGTSFATPVAVAMAALILEFVNQTRCQKLKEESSKKVRLEELKQNWGMSRVLEAISKKSADGYLWISPMLLWEGFQDNGDDDTAIEARKHGWNVICKALEK